MLPKALAGRKTRAFVKLNFKMYGSGQPVLILHGLFGSLDNWHSIGVRLAQTFRIYAVNLRNHGRSPHSPQINYELMAEDLREMLADQGLESVSLIGHSLGGKTAMQFALMWPDLVTKLVVADIAPRAYPPTHEPVFQALLSLDLSSFRTRNEIEQELAAAIPDLAVRRFLLKNLARDLAGGFHWQMNLPGLHENYGRLIAALESEKACEKPALFLRGEKSDYIQKEDETMILRLFPRAEIRTLENADHWLHADVPETFLRNVQEFFNG